MLRKMLGLGGGMLKFLALAHTCWMLRKMLGWGWGDVNVPCLALAHMLDATHMAPYQKMHPSKFEIS